MSYQLKTTGLATELLYLVAVDEDGTIKEFVDGDVNSNMTLDTGVEAGVGTGSWNGSARKYFPTFKNTDYDFYGVNFASGHRPTWGMKATDGFTLFEAYHSTDGSAGGTGSRIHYSDPAYPVSPNGLRRNSSTGKAEFNSSGSSWAVSATTMPSTGSTKYSLAFGYKYAAGDEFGYGLEGGTLSSDSTGSIDAWAYADGEIIGIGGVSGQGCDPLSRYVSAAFKRKLTIAEEQTLNEDWFGTLFDVPAPAPTITTNPGNATVTEPATANFTATATGATSLKWQKSTDGGTTPIDVSDGTGGTTGTTSGNYTTGATAVSSGSWRNGYKVRCAFSGDGGSTWVYTAWATLTVNAPGDVTAPTLSNPSVAATGATAATLSVTTTDANGTAYAIITTGTTPPSVAQIQAGHDSGGGTPTWAGNQVVSAAGVLTFNATGLTASTTYYAHFQHKDAAGNDSTVSTSSSFTTDATVSVGAARNYYSNLIRG